MATNPVQVVVFAATLAIFPLSVTAIITSAVIAIAFNIIVFGGFDYFTARLTRDKTLGDPDGNKF